MEKFNFNQSPVEGKEEESLFDPRLEDLWEEYDFPGKPPRKGTSAEKRLYDTCTLYSQFIIGDMSGHSLRQKTSSDADRRTLHNQVAVMVVGKKRSGMETEEARHIADFAFEYARGISHDDYLKYKDREED